MDRAGQGNGARKRHPRGLDDGGYIMVVLLIGMAVSAVWMGAMLPAWRTQAIREKEAELIFRAEQCARAIALYQRKNGTLPRDVDLLVSQRYLRKKYLDPMTGKDFLYLGSATPVGGQNPTPPGPGRAGSPQTGPQAMQAGISGCRSTSLDRSLRVYQNQQSYSQWPFDYQLALQKMGQQIGGPNPNRPGRETGPGGGPQRGGPQRGGPTVPGGGIDRPGLRPGGPGGLGPGPGGPAGPGTGPGRRGG